MNKQLLKAILISGLLVPGLLLKGDPPTPPPAPSHVQTEIRLNVDKKTNMVHFISTNNDPQIITKTYVLQYADPYELRPYLRSALGAERINNDGGKVECVKYNDGTGILLISAEDYKFDKAVQNGGMTIDDIVKMLDRPKITSSSGKKSFIYFPRYRTAADLVALLCNSGMSIAHSVQENERGKDEAYVDNELNAIWFYLSNWSTKYVQEMIKVYDQPLPTVRVTYKIYEIDHENDDRIGADWQAWKNGPGSDFFTAASRYSNGWNFANNIPGLPWVGKSHTQFLKFSPRWNSRFIDFLAAKGRATVLTSGVINLVNGEEGSIEALTQFPTFVQGEANGDITLLGYVRYTNARIRQKSNKIQIDFDNDGIYEVGIAPVDMHDRKVEVNLAATGQNLLISKIDDGSSKYYYLKLQDDLAASAGLQFVARGYGNIGTEVRCIGDFSDGDIDWQSDHLYVIPKDNNRQTQINNLISDRDSFGFHLKMLPSVCGQTTTIDIHISNTSLIGFQNNGTPRTERSEYNTKLMLANDGSRFVIGGIEKKSSINSVSKFPWLGSIPGFGWLFGSESTVGKSVRIVSVLECIPVTPQGDIPTKVAEELRHFNKTTKCVGDKNNNIGYDQWLLDKHKKKIQPLP